MALIVPYQTNGFARRAMIQRAMTSVGTRAAGRPVFAIADPRRSIQPVTRGFGNLACDYVPTVDYQIAKRMPLGALGVSTAVTAAKGAYSGATVGAAATGTTILGAAAAGSVVPIIGTAVGLVIGLFASGVFNHKADPEVANFDAAVALYKQNPNNALNIADKYLVLAGLFDLQASQIKGNIPIFKKYGRMGEQRFVTDMINTIYQAAQSGRIKATDTVQSVKTNIVQPWIDSWGFGPMTDSNAGLIDLIILGMIAEYVAGAQGQWTARGGDFPFASLPKFALPPPPAAALPPALPPPAQQMPATVTPSSACGAPYVWNGSQCVLPASTPASAPNPIQTQTPASCVSPYVWNGTQCVLPAAAVPVTPGAGQGAVYQGPPAGYSMVGTDSSGVPVYANAQGVLYQWSGQPGGGMSIWAGQLASNASAAAQMQAALQNALAQGQSSAQAAAAALQQAQTAGVANTPQLQDQVAQQVAATQSAPVQPVAAGIGTGTIGLLVGGGIILSLLLAKMQQPNKGRSRG